MDMYAEHYRGDFQSNHEKKVPRHPWHIFKQDRKEVRETFEGDEKHERVYVLQQLFEEYKEKWETYRANFKKEEREN